MTSIRFFGTQTRCLEFSFDYRELFLCFLVSSARRRRISGRAAATSARTSAAGTFTMRGAAGVAIRSVAASKTAGESSRKSAVIVAAEPADEEIAVTNL